jgi:hypothetical protein
MERRPELETSASRKKKEGKETQVEGERKIRAKEKEVDEKEARRYKKEGE